ncbi:BLUF domain protein [Pedobacter sp. BAL39]|uniref:BLUF domain-containing protein n=1 Tax=Pedobacter sp. BAL39 TaxID=391596 RepID=UPI0001559BA2|nr:BLUF domain-containing protein [Pedobacter sp. BAL39]EDM37785.1 BLUF domain protein [Pedobacter sp. BAL39]
MSEPTYYLLYSSKTGVVLPESELVQLLEQSRINNIRQHITGMLLYLESLTSDPCAGRFIQVLEGREADVKRLYNLIEQDLRHFGITILSEGLQKKRYFGEWTMGFARFDRNANYNAQFDPGAFFLDETNAKDSNHLLVFLHHFYDPNLNSAT